MMQDVTFRNLHFHDNPCNEFLTCAGHNFVVENMTGKIYIWDRTNSFVLRDSKHVPSLSLRAGSRTRSGYYRVHDNTFGKVDVNEAGKGGNPWRLVVKGCTVNGRASGSGGRFLNCEIGKSTLGPGEFRGCHVHDMSGENHGGTYRNCRLENVSGNMHGTFDIDHCTITGWKCNSGGQKPSYLFRNSQLTDFSIHFGYWFQGATTLFENCTITSKGALVKLPHYAMKHPIRVNNCRFTTSGADGMICYYDDRTGGSAGKLTDQETLMLEGNVLKLGTSPYVVTGLTGKAKNQINLVARGNQVTPEKVALCNPEARKSKQINVVEK
jgi:hypothetical protein